MDRGKREKRPREGLVTSAMGEIVRRKRKGRPPKPDLSRRARSPTQEEGRTVRRSLRRRNVRYSSFIDYGDFIDDEFELDREDEEVLEEEDEDVELRRGRKVKLVVKLSRQRERGGRAIESGDSGSEVGAVTDEGDEEEEEESESDGRVLKKRGISGREEEDGDLDDNDQEDDYGCEEEASGRRGYSKGHESPRGMPSDFVSEIPLPDKKTLELILDKLQKKDIYGVYAEPVDPEELPDYHDIIEKPMDFSTVRKKLANGSYTTINQFESDVFLICTNAMQYNASDTVYHKQARNIQELGRKKFLKLRIKYEQSLKENKVEQQVATDHESSERDVKSDQRVKSNLSVKKLMKKPFARSTQEPVSSDFSGVAMPATTGDQYPNSDANQRAYNERHGVDDGLMDGNAASAENFTDKAEDVSVGRGFSFQRPCVQDENRRATYNISSHPVVRSNSIFTTFDGETRQLVAVGLQAEYSYAQSLARFAASLGPIAWKVASQRIEQSLPSECKFGRGWVVEYEPVPTPIIFTRKSTCEFPPVVKPLSRDVFPRKQGTAFKMMPLAMKDVEHCSALDARKSAFLHGNSMGSLGSQTRKSHQVPSPCSSNRAQPETKAVKQFELNSLPSLPHNNGDTTHAPEEKIPDNSRVTDLRSRETTVASVNHLQPKKSERIVLRSTEAPVRSVAGRQMLPLAQFDINGTTRKMSTGKLQKNGLDPGRTVAAARTTGTNKANKMSVPPFYFSQQDQGLSDPVQIMKLLSEKAQRQETPSTPADNQRAMKNVSSGREASGNIAAVGSWMTIGAGGNKQSIHNAKAQKIQAMSQLQYHANPQPTGVHGSKFPVSSGVQFQEEKNGIPFRGLVQNPTFGFNEARFQPQALQSPQAIPVDFSRVQVQSHWRGVTIPQPPQQRLKQDTLPPDLNIGFHSPASPVKQSPGVMVDSQQPDLALQL